MTRDNTQYLRPLIERLSRQARSVHEAIELFQPLLADEVGSASLFVDAGDERISPATLRSTAAFLDSHQFPFRGLYTAPLKVGRRRVGLLVAFFGSFGAPGVPGELLPALTDQLAKQLNEILARTTRAITQKAVA